MAPASLDAEGFTAAFARHGRTLWVLASAWVGRADADDLVQETARVAWQRRATITSPDPAELGPWLASIARNLGANWRRKRRPDVVDPVDLDPVGAVATPPIGWPFDFDRAGLPDELARPLAALPEVARSCLLLSAVLGLGFAEIGRLLEIPENTAQSHARRARLALREAMTAAEPSSPAAARMP